MAFPIKKGKYQLTQIINVTWQHGQEAASGQLRIYHITSYPTRANGIIVLVNSRTGFCRRFLFPQLQSGKFLNLARYFPYDVKLRLLAHSRSFLANQTARNAIVGAENLLNYNIIIIVIVIVIVFVVVIINIVANTTIKTTTKNVFPQSNHFSVLVFD